MGSHVSRALWLRPQRDLVTPYPDLPTRFAVVSWGQRLVTDGFDREAFEAFYAAHVDQASESTLAPSLPPEGSSCQ